MQHTKLLWLRRFVRGFQSPHYHRLCFWAFFRWELISFYFPHRICLALKHLVLSHDSYILALDALACHRLVKIFVSIGPTVWIILTGILWKAIEQLLVTQWMVSKILNIRLWGARIKANGILLGLGWLVSETRHTNKIFTSLLTKRRSISLLGKAMRTQAVKSSGSQGQSWVSLKVKIAKHLVLVRFFLKLLLFLL